MSDKTGMLIENLDYSSTDCQILIREYSKLIYQLTKKYNTVVDENELLYQQIEQLKLNIDKINKDNSVPVSVLPIPNSLCPECINMMNSLSWRITKPLRMIKRLYTNLKLYNYKFTFKKVITRLKTIGNKIKQ